MTRFFKTAKPTVAVEIQPGKVKKKKKIKAKLTSAKSQSSSFTLC